MISNAAVATTQGSRYLQQLCKHWAHKFPVSFTPEHGEIRFESGAVAVLDAEPEVLRIKVSTIDAEAAEQMEGVVARHIERFAFREELVFDWSREDVELM